MTQSGEHLEASIAPQFERLDEPSYFEIRLGSFRSMGFISGFIGGCIYYPGIHKGIRAWRERRF